MRLLCDEMLGGLCRWLRAAGHDCVLASAGTPDAALLDAARGEDRTLVSRDRRLVEAAGDRGLLLTEASLDDQAATLGRRLGLDWMAAPFTRCLVDNTPLRPAEPGELAAIPERSRDLPGPFRTCPDCGRVYWPGSHVRRMLAKLESWRESAQA